MNGFFTIFLHHNPQIIVSSDASKGHFGTTGHVIPAVFAIALCHAMFGVDVCVGVVAVNEISLVVLYLNM
jgi:hypothetical protein